MATQTTKIRNGSLILPRQIQEIWQEADVLIHIDKNRLIVEKRPEKYNVWKQWQKAAGILKNHKLPDGVKWQQKIRQEWERKLP